MNEKQKEMFRDGTEYIDRLRQIQAPEADYQQFLYILRRRIYRWENEPQAMWWPEEKIIQYFFNHGYDQLNKIAETKGEKENE
jgi:hypothetical protein